MADENRSNITNAVAKADPSQTTVVFSGNLADDDRLWAVRCSVSELRNMLIAPNAWVASLAALPTWDPKVPAPTLADDYAVMTQRTDDVQTDGWVMVQGISGTNAITVVASRASALLAAALEVGQVPDILAAFWAAVGIDAGTGRKKAYKVELVASLRRWFGHLEVANSVGTIESVATRASAYLLVSLYDTVGHAALLSELEQEISGASSEGSLPTHIRFVPATLTPTSTVYVSHREASAEDPGPTPPPTFCSFDTGPYDPTGGASVGGGIIKRYANDDPSPPPK